MKTQFEMKKDIIKKLGLVLLMVIPLSVLAQSEFYVSDSQNNSGNGTIERPFNTIYKAVEEARKEKGEVTIYIREGIYRLNKPVIFTPEDGNALKKLTIKAYSGEKVIVSSGIKLNLEWQPYRQGIMRAKMNSDTLRMDMLIADGEIQHMARYPNYDERAVRFNGTSAQATSPERVKKWKHPEGGYLHAMHQHDWGDFHYRITGKNKKGELTLEGGWQNNRRMGIHSDNRMIENVFEELDVPGEWYWDRADNFLYYYPISDENVDDVTFESPQLKHLVEFRGSEKNPVSNITIEGLVFTQTVRTFMEHYESLLRSDWTIYRGAAILLEGTENCFIRNCDLYNLGGNAIFFSNYNRYSGVSNSHIMNIGASAICFVGDTQAVRSPSFEYNEFVPLNQMDTLKGPKNNNYPAHCSVYDNLIHSIGLFEKQITGIELSMCRSITVCHNSIYDTPRAGINISEGTWGGHILEFNDVFDTVKETGDHGSFNSWGRDRYWHPDYKIMESIVAQNPALILADALETVVIRNNRFRCDRGWDIDLDDGSSNYHIYNNLCLNGGIKLREGFYRIVENNILVNNTFHPHIWFQHSGDIFIRNIVMTGYKPINLKDWGLMVDYNIFTDSVACKNSQRNDNDMHSVVEMVAFKNPSEGDFSVPDASDAILKGGFHNFPMDRFGVVSPRLKAIAHTPEMPAPIIISNALNKEFESWNGINIKNLQSLGERSATGMDAERGVYVVSVDALGSSLRDYIRSNDVILKIGNKTVNNLKDMKEALEVVNETENIDVVIFRNQKENQVSIPGKCLK